MTKNTKTKKRRSKRSRIKNPNLSRKYNIKARRDYIETDYIDGIYSEDGKEIMRPLTDEEKGWLDQYYKEVVNANLKNSKLYKDGEDKKKIYNENNARNRCLYNQAKKTGKLVRIDPAEYDKRTLKILKDYDLEHVVVNDSDLLKDSVDDDKKN